MSVSSSVLELADDTPRTTFPLMPVWHTNVEDPTSVRRSTVPVLPKPQLQDVPMAETAGEDFFATATVVSSVPQRPKRKQRSNGVSCGVTRATWPPLTIFFVDFLQQTRMETWLLFAPTIFYEVTRHDGLQGHASPPQCARCSDGLGVYKCVDCTSTLLYCSSCIIFRHDSTPLHNIKVRHIFLSNTSLF